MKAKRLEKFEAKQGYFLHINLKKSFKLVPWSQNDWKTEWLIIRKLLIWLEGEGDVFSEIAKLEYRELSLTSGSEFLS